jgi:hypothetical protein
MAIGLSIVFIKFIKLINMHTESKGLTYNPRRPIIAVGIDGTSSREWRKPDGSNSHVHKFISNMQMNYEDKQYYDGPSDYGTGRSVEIILQEALAFVMSRLKILFPERFSSFRPLSMAQISHCYSYNNVDEMIGKTDALRAIDEGVDRKYKIRRLSKFQPPTNERQLTSFHFNNQPLSAEDVWIVLTGHSRGGPAVVELAKLLAPIVPVYFLGLYDAVDRQPCLNSDKVENVIYTYHARRNVEEMNSRNLFGNAATSSSTGFYEEKYFDTAHGGVGGDFENKKSGFVNKYLNMGVDTTCVPDTEDFYYDEMNWEPQVIKRKNTWAKDSVFKKPGNEGKNIEQICADGRDKANAWIREKAMLRGVPLND